MDYEALAAEYFAPRELQLLIRTVTRLLQLTNPVRGGDYAQGNLSRYALFLKAQEHGRVTADGPMTQQMRYFTAFHLVQLLNKGGSEVSAVLPESFEYPPFLPQWDLRKAIREKEILLITRNPQFGELKRLGSSGDPFAALEYKLQCETPSQGGLSISHDAVEEIITWHKQFDDGNIPIKHIAANAVALLKQNHQAASGEDSRRIYHTLTLFTFITCLPKIHQRVEYLSRGKNFFYLITMPFDHCQHRDLPAELQVFKERLMSLDEMDNLCTEDLDSRLPVRDEKRAVRHLVDMNFLSNQILLNPLFDKRGRRTFLQVLSKCLSKVDQACSLAWKSYHKSGRPKKGIEEKFGNVSPENMESFKKDINDLVKGMRALWILVRIFPAETKKVLKWLKTCMDVKHSTLEEKQMFSAGKQPPEDKSLVVTPEPEDMLAQYIAAHDIEEDGLDPEWFEVHMITRHSTWDEAAFKLLETMIMHVNSLQILKKESVLEEGRKVTFIDNFLSRLDLLSVELTPTQLDQKMHPWDSASLKVFIPDEDARQAFEQFIESHQRSKPGKEVAARTEHFPGTAHCECIGLMLHVLKYPTLFDNRKFSCEDFSKILSAHGVEVAEETINHFMQAGDVLAVTKRCCPVCHLVVEMVRALQMTHIEKGRSQRPPALVYTGAHVEWSATSLPPHTPKVIAEEIYKQLRARLDEAVAQIYYLQRSGSYTRVKTSTPGSYAGPSPHATFKVPVLGNIAEEPEKSTSTVPIGPGDFGDLVYRANPARDPPTLPAQAEEGREAASRSVSPSPARGRSQKRRASQSAADALDAPPRKSRSPSLRRSTRSPTNKSVPFPGFFSTED